MLRIAIVDDDAGDAETLKGYVARYCGEHEREFSRGVSCAEFSSGEAFLAEKESFDVVFFDIEMPGLNGMETARRLRDRNENVIILFITNMAQYALEGYEVQALDFVVKPLSYFEFSMKFNKIRRFLQKSGEKPLSLKTVEGECVRLTSDDISYVEVMRHYLEYHTSGGAYRVRGTIKEAEEELSPYGFARCAKSYLVNLKKIRSVKGNRIEIGEEALYIGRTRKAEFLDKFYRYIGGIR